MIDYNRALSRLFIVEDPPAWSPALRSGGPLPSAITRYFVDPSLAAAALGAGRERLLADPQTLGVLFECLVIRDLRIHAQTMAASVAHFREAKGVEADAILKTRDGRWAALEVKRGQREPGDDGQEGRRAVTCGRSPPRAATCSRRAGVGRSLQGRFPS